MATEQNNQEHLKNEESSGGQQKQSQNNSGNFAREPGVDEKDTAGFNSEGRDLSEKPVNESGIAENQEHHWSGNYGHKSSTRPGSKNSDPYSDQNLSDGVQQNQGRNHVSNAGGTSQEDLEKGNTGLRDNEDTA